MKKFIVNIDKRQEQRCLSILNGPGGIYRNGEESVEPLKEIPDHGEIMGIPFVRIPAILAERWNKGELIIKKWNEEEALCHRALLVFGSTAQRLKACEECGELIRAISRCDLTISDEEKVKRSKDNLVEEIADVEVMIHQMLLLYGIDAWDIEKVKVEKLSRLKDRLGHRPIVGPGEEVR